MVDGNFLQLLDCVKIAGVAKQMNEEEQKDAYHYWTDVAKKVRAEEKNGHPKRSNISPVQRGAGSGIGSSEIKHNRNLKKLRRHISHFTL